ncbi:hypothetical protein CHS0354_005650 [Potamilus streckersoni]|uniref:Soluble calcium-activated nucleotidase 1 n=1 Tax=Potamilus streckersoni TaxID=2493646 RepID=A0AAE0S0T3_9BIVA|nr:hypothetical protein CHS0354_005650 [Potamilus streckersoni]
MKAASYPYAVHDWMKAIRTPTPYRVGNAKFHLKPRNLAYGAMFSTAVFILIYFFISKTQSLKNICYNEHDRVYGGSQYDFTYPLSHPLRTPVGYQYTVAVVSDLDTDSRSKLKPNTWISYLNYGNFTISDDQSHVEVIFNDNPVVLSSTLSQEGRGMELSELIVFNGKLYSVDDRTGVVYEILDNKAIPWVLLTDGNGRDIKGFKCEWATVKDERLFVGGIGKEWTSINGEVINQNPQWVKSIGPVGDVTHLDWHKEYNAMRDKTGTNLPGYMIHESGMWSKIHQRWFFLPRRFSMQRYDEKADERRASNVMIICDDDFQNIEVRYIGKKNPVRGFSSFKFVPGTNDNVIVALKSEEDDGKIATYILVFTIEGKILLNETKIGDKKYEGIEFV